MKDVALRAGKWEKLCVICVLLALKAMLPNQFIFGFHRGVTNGQRGVDLSEAPRTKDLKAQLYLVHFSFSPCNPDTCLP